jgi:UDP-glucose 4-epimerase
VTILVTGGAGYIGSHMCWHLRDAGQDFVVIDNLSTGVRANLPKDAPFIEGDAGDRALLDKTMRKHKVSAVIHFAGSIIVPESVEKPLMYYENNTAKSRTLIEACVENGVERFVFSSTAAVYGMPEIVPVDEDAPTDPISPYGTSKLMTEWMLRDAAAAHGLRYAALRYFNVAGADPQGRTGQSTPRATHLIKVACQAALDSSRKMHIYGDDYPTADGTCIRDYIHVTDLAEVHALALGHLTAGGDSVVLNCGYGHGYSVREVLAMVEKVAGVDLGAEPAPRRAGDPAQLIAANGRLVDLFGWAPAREDLETIVRTALDWERHLSG